MLKIKKILFTFFLLFCNANSMNENLLRKKLFSNYNKNNKPVKNISDSVLLKYGLEINSLVYFNQKAENVEITLKKTLMWADEYLTWNLTNESPKYITVDNNIVWKPDLELYNAASKPKLFNKNSRVKIYNNGSIEFIEYVSYLFSCKLNLRDFPYDSQTCNMLFGSWKYPKKILDIQPFNNDKFDNFSVSPDFSHNEWLIDNIDVQHNDNKYKCCPGDLWPNSIYSVTFKRNPHKYNVLIVMSICITLSALTVSQLKVYNYFRTYILVFIPLTLIWLQINTSSKIPVIEGSTRLENIIMTCFFITIISCFESGILYCLTSNKNDILGKYFKIIDYTTVKCGYHFEKFIPIQKHDKEYTNLDYEKFINIILYSDNIFKITIIIIFIINLIVLLSY